MGNAASYVFHMLQYLLPSKFLYFISSTKLLAKMKHLQTIIYFFYFYISVSSRELLIKMEDPRTMIVTWIGSCTRGCVTFAWKMLVACIERKVYVDKRKGHSRELAVYSFIPWFMLGGGVNSLSFSTTISLLLRSIRVFLSIRANL